MKQTKQFLQKEEGNVLFLILIAVALFAALSYAVTQSSRGGNNANKETNILNSAQVTQYPTQVRTAVLRMMIDGTAPENLRFNTPSDFAAVSADPSTTVFHPSGGEAVYQTPPSGLVDTTVNPLGRWFFNTNYEITNLGSANTGEVIAYLPGISSSMCTELNDEFGIATTPAFGSDILASTGSAVGGSTSADVSMGLGSDTDGGNYDTDLGHVDFPSALASQPFGCFENNNTGSGEFVYYHVIVER